ncbi:MAG: hypothetical protein QGH73_12950 [Rhodospirillales bacterium]|jgi:hypothetical protein|nr:hypothetical protein [Rhodospirillaceae bacterium]MDP6427596.1 hypothetical protein [Rhodospirillales bacterium]MDP6643488.1 hypothetical protein [Rhodospirillales bacterium]MDP6842580.1 hypothetical protein [Rhodospirillales bacterium]|tara:strand:- start:1928 stop:2371 length:444 start_codon:yes stop_codon:yes gene_type:complete
MGQHGGTLHLKGGCHCGNVRFRFVCAEPIAGLPPRACGCAFCTKHGGRWTSDPGGALHLYASDSGAVNKYRFGHGTADFIVCGNCGAVTAAVSDIDAKLYAVVNVNCLDDPASFSEPSAAVDYEGEERAGRLDRRKERWIGEVTVDF